MERPRESSTLLALLQAVDGDDQLTQRRLAARVGAALGLTNALIKRCARKGLIKIGEAPARRYAYYLTPKGLLEKTRLVGEYLSFSLHFFRRARADYTDILGTCRRRGWTRVVLAGTGELAEIAILSGQECDLRPIAVIDPARNIDHFLGIPVVRGPAEAGEFDAVVITDANAPQATYDDLAALVDEERIFAPPLLHISRGAETPPKGGRR